MEQQKHILVVDDNPQIRSILSRLFEKDYSVLQAENGKVALEQFQEHANSVSAVLLDLTMPEYDGIYFLKQMAAQYPPDTVPIICITGDERDTSLIQAYHLHADNYIMKPFHADHVRRVVQSAIRNAEEPAMQRTEYDHMTFISRLMALLNRCHDHANACHTALELVGAYLGADRVSLYMRPMQGEGYQWDRDGVESTYRATYRWLVTHDWCNGWTPPEEWLLSVGPEQGSYKEYQSYYDAYGIRSMLCLKIEGIRAERAYLMIENPSRSAQDLMLYAAMQGCFSLAVKTIELGIVDQKTGVYNRRLYSDYLRRLGQSAVQSLGMIVMNLNSMHQYISIYGQAAGDELLEHTAAVLLRNINAPCFRTGGDEFTAVLRNVTQEETESVMEQVSQACRAQNIGLSLGCAWRDRDIDPEELFKAADRNMREAKRKHYNSLNVTNR